MALFNGSNAVSANAGILAMLKVYYAKEGVANLMFRNSPVVKEIKKQRVEGKSQNFSAMYGRGGSVGADFTQAKTNASKVSKAKEFAVEPGQIFSVYSMNTKEIEASKTNRGAYMKIAGAKMFAASESFRKTLAASFYGRGFGELCNTPLGVTVTNASVKFDNIPSHALMGIDIGSMLVIKEHVSDTAIKANLEVTAIDGNTIVCNATNADSGSYDTKATDVLCLAGSMTDGGDPLLPMGLGGWLPTVAHRTGSTWTTYIEKKMFGVDRNVAPERLAGAFYDGTKAGAKEKKSDSIKKLIQRCRRAGSQADLIVMNDEDWMDFSAEIESTNTYFTQTSTTSKKNATTGMTKLAAAFSTNYIENIYDDPYCPKGVFYVLDKEYVELWSYTNTEKIDDGVAGNNPGKPDVMEAGAGAENKPDQLVIDDYINIQPGQDTIDGPASNVSLMFYGSFVVTNPSVCGVGIFHGAKVIEEA